MYSVVVSRLVGSELVFFSFGLIMFSRFCSIKCVVWVLVLIVVRINSVLNRMVKWY